MCAYDQILKRALLSKKPSGSSLLVLSAVAHCIMPARADRWEAQASKGKRGRESLPFYSPTIKSTVYEACELPCACWRTTHSRSANMCSSTAPKMHGIHGWIGRSQHSHRKNCVLLAERKHRVVDTHTFSPFCDSVCLHPTRTSSYDITNTPLPLSLSLGASLLAWLFFFCDPQC